MASPTLKDGTKPIGKGSIYLDHFKAQEAARLAFAELRLKWEALGKGQPTRWQLLRRRLRSLLGQ